MPLKSQDLKQALAKMAANQHFCSIYEDLDEWLANARSLLGNALNNGKRCIIAAAGTQVMEIKDAVRFSGFLYTNSEEAGQMVFADLDEIRAGSITPLEALSWLAEQEKDAAAAGWKGLCIIEDMSWFLNDPDRLDLLSEYEAALDRQYLGSHETMYLCQYDWQKFPLEYVKEVIISNPVIIKSGNILQNRFFIPQVDYSDEKREERKIQYLIKHLEREYMIQRRNQFLADMVARTSEAFVVASCSGGIMFFNPAFSKMVGYSEKELHIVSWNKLLIMDDEHRSSLRNLKGVDRSQVSIRFEAQLIHKNGLRIPAELVVHYANEIDDSYYYVFINDITERKKAEESLRVSENNLRLITDNMLDMVSRTDINGILEYVSPSHETVLGYRREELMGRSIYKFVHPADLTFVRSISDIAFTNGVAPRTEFRLRHRDGHYVWIECTGKLIFDRLGRVEGAVFSNRDVTRRKKVEKALVRSENRLKKQVKDLNILIDNMNELFITYDTEGKFTYLNRKCTEMLGWEPHELKGIHVTDIADDESRDIIKRAINVRLSGESNSYELSFRRKDGSKCTARLNGSPIIENGKVLGGMALIEDVTDRKQAEEQLKFLSLHDALTGIYNRTYFEEEMNRLENGRFDPVGLIMCDVDGLKMVNDSLGHDAGDRLLVTVAKVMQECLRENDVIARVGGDEFAVLMPCTPRPAVEEAVRRLRESVAAYNEGNPTLPLSMSIGIAFRCDSSQSMSFLFKQADNNMYREKLHRRQSARGAIVQTMMKALEARDFITEGHADRMQDLVQDIAIRLGLPEYSVADLRLLAQFHDIGKVGIPDRILFKPGALTPEETAEMRRHSEIGHRIALSAPDLAPIADWILKHHECWNGKGYPLGLVGKEIPLECRILAIADAFDAMTSDRPYRKAVPPKEALDEIQRCAGTQFDPLLVSQFVRVIQNKFGSDL